MYRSMADAVTVHHCSNRPHHSKTCLRAYADSEGPDPPAAPRRLITKTYLYNFYPRKPHFYKVKLGFTGVLLIFLILVQKHRLWVLVTAPTIYVFEQNYEKYLTFLSENFQFLEVTFSIYLNRRVFVMWSGPSFPQIKLFDTTICSYGNQMPGWDFTHIQDDLNPHILLEGTILHDAAQV